MAISKNSRRVQFTLNSSKEKEKEIIKFLDGCFNPNVAIKEIIFNYIVSNCESKLPQVTHLEVPQSYTKSLQVSNFNDNIVSDSDCKLVEVSNRDKKLHEVNEIEKNEIEELNKFL
ncbi:hypothetical protein EXN57_13235 [Clostridium botulinum]|nr:hypothetical protein [Clostridium botulinum]NFD35091.1 hypothetical protein [Clostridium botulinum]NFD59985.1 hypothetical protein [Clostridium botulinum]NFE02230.1 hypothetical protein [Clostridium botulinum]